MSNAETMGPQGPLNGHDPRPVSVPGVSDLSSFRGRSGRGGVPILPPGWRPDQVPVPTAGDTRTRTAPVARPAPRPPGGDATIERNGSELRTPTVQEARVVPSTSMSTSTGPEVRVVRKVRPWSVWKMVIAFSTCMVAVVATAGAILWATATALGVLDNVEGFIEDLGFENFAFHGGAMLRALVIGGLIVAVAASLMATVLATMFNLLSDITGGIEAEVGPPRTRRSRRARRRDRKGGRPDAGSDAGDEVVRGPGATVAVEPERVTVAAAGVELSRSARPVLDLTDDPEVTGPEADEDDHIQRAIDELLLRDVPPAEDA